MKSSLMTIFLAMAASTYAQYYAGWQAVDTVTAGDFDDHDPQLDHGGLGAAWFFPPPFEWLVFDRQSDTQNSICAMKVKLSTGSGPPSVQWDSSMIISATPAYVVQKEPDICTNFRTIYTGSADSTIVQTIAAWQEMDARLDRVIDAWDIYYSFSSGSEGEWSTPQLLSAGNIHGGNVKVRPLSDSSFILIWRSGNALMFSAFLSGNMSSPDTLVVTNYDSLEFDCEAPPNLYPQQPIIAWTAPDSTGKVVCFTAQITSLDPIVLSRLDTISSDGDIGEPKFIEYLPGTMMYNVKDTQRVRPVFAADFFDYPYGSFQQYDLTPDSSSSNLNAVGVTGVPIIAAISKANKKIDASSTIPGLELYAWERWSNSDTTLVFMSVPVDTVVSPGYNRNLAFSTYGFQRNDYTIFPCVWESNRTGRTHIYGRVGTLYIDAVIEPPQRDQTFVLQQNYPNPFNPTTTIRYQVPSISHVTLKVYDVLGREVATLVNEIMKPGGYEVKFDGSQFASGVFFCRIIAGGMVATRKMVLVK